VEIMIVVAIIGLLAAIAIPNFVRARTTSQQKRLHQQPAPDRWSGPDLGLGEQEESDRYVHPGHR